MLTTYLSYRLAAADMTKTLDRTAAEPQVAREVEYWRENIGKVKDIESFVNDRRLFAFAMKAYGLEDMTYAKAFMKKVLEGGVTDEKSMANKLTDGRYREFAKVFDFATYGELTTALSWAKVGTVDRYVRQTVEESVGAQSEGARLALYFQRKAADLTSPLQILADAALLKVAQTALNLPASMSNMDIDKQVDLIASKLDMEDLQDASKLDAFMKRFAVLYDVGNSSAVSSSPAIQVLTGASSSGLSVDTMMSLAKLKTGG